MEHLSEGGKSLDKKCGLESQSGESETSRGEVDPSAQAFGESYARHHEKPGARLEPETKQSQSLAAALPHSHDIPGRTFCVARKHLSFG